jgi:hypothetical protein
MMDGSVTAEGLGDGPTHGRVAIAKMLLTLPPIMQDHLAFAQGRTGLSLELDGLGGYDVMLPGHRACMAGWWVATGVPHAI